MKMEPATYKIKDLLELRRNRMLTVNAEYQRGPVWKPAQKKRLIDSVLRGYPIPLIYLHHIKTEVASHRREDFELIDGQQRINSFYEFSEGSFRLFDPVKDEKEARFPSFIKLQPCPWGGKDFESLSADQKSAFLERELPIVKITTTDPNEARDLFIRLQAGMPLNSQEKRDAWPGDFTEFVLKVGGKPEIARYPGHPFLRTLMGAGNVNGRGKHRQLAAQMIMLFLTRRFSGAKEFCDINAGAIDDFYYEHLDFDRKSADAERFVAILDKLVELLGEKKRKKLIGHEAIHLVLLVDGLLDQYTRSWEGRFTLALDAFRDRLARDKRTKDDDVPGEYWLRYGSLTRVNSDRAENIRRRHEFFCQKMYEVLSPLEPKDKQRLFGPLEREVIYYRDKKKCAVCKGEVLWEDADIHHVVGHGAGGPTVIENGALVHRDCHPKGPAAEEFARKWRAGPPSA